MGTFSFPKPALQAGAFATTTLAPAHLTEGSLGTQRGQQEQVRVARPSGIGKGHRTKGWWLAQGWLPTTETKAPGRRIDQSVKSDTKVKAPRTG